jgi:hypothetical protein
MNKPSNQFCLLLASYWFLRLAYYSSTLNTVVTCSSETSVDFKLIILHNHRCEDLKSDIFCFVLLLKDTGPIDSDIVNNRILCFEIQIKPRALYVF